MNPTQNSFTPLYYNNFQHLPAVNQHPIILPSFVPLVSSRHFFPQNENSSFLVPSIRRQNGIHYSNFPKTTHSLSKQTEKTGNVTKDYFDQNSIEKSSSSSYSKAKVQKKKRKSINSNLESNKKVKYFEDKEPHIAQMGESCLRIYNQYVATTSNHLKYFYPSDTSTDPKQDSEEFRNINSLYFAPAFMKIITEDAVKTISELRNENAELKERLEKLKKSLSE